MRFPVVLRSGESQGEYLPQEGAGELDQMGGNLVEVMIEGSKYEVWTITEDVLARDIYHS